MNTRNKEGRSEAHVDLLDALKGADVPESEIEAAMEDMQFGPEEKQEIWAELKIKQGDTTNEN